MPTRPRGIIRRETFVARFVHRRHGGISVQVPGGRLFIIYVGISLVFAVGLWVLGFGLGLWLCCLHRNSEDGTRRA